MTPNEQTIATCDTLLRGELAAIETYSQAIHKFPEDARMGCLNSIRNKMELKENIDRELWLLYCNTVKKQPTDGNQDKALM